MPALDRLRLHSLRSFENPARVPLPLCCRRGTRERLAQIDFIKAAAILAVIFTHAGPTPWQPTYTPLDLTLRYSWVSFQVPAFLMIAGFLYQRPGALPWREVERRLRRSLIPYAIASGVAYGIGFWNPANVQEALSQLAAWQTVGIYPFIRMLALCVVAACPLSRLSLRASGHALAAFAVAATALGIWGRILGLGFAIPPYTGVSVNLLTDAVLYPLTYFLIGWLTAAFLSRLASRAARFEPQLLALGLAVIACWFAAAPAFETLAHFADVARALYSVAVVGVLAITTQRLRVPRVILFLSEASLGIYLYHIFFELIFAPHAAAWPPLLRILASASIDLAGAAAVCLLARRVLGGRLARALIGA